MKFKNAKLEYYAMYYDWSIHKITKINVLGDRYKQRVYDKIKKGKITNAGELKEDLRTYLMYHYWCKSEYEILVGDLYYPSDDAERLKNYYNELEKIDVFTQVEPNLDVVVTYIINEMDIRF